MLLGDATDAQPAATEPDEQKQVDMIAAMGRRIVDVVNQSMRIAHDSKDIETRRSRLRVARENIARLSVLADEYPFLKIERLADVESDLAKIDSETDELERPGFKLSSELRFHAMPRISTPLASLVRHGEMRTACGELPAFPGGRWLPVTPSLRETFRTSLGVDDPSLATPSIGASDAGAVDLERYIAFLTSLKRAAISCSSVEENAFAVDAICEMSTNRDYVDAHGGVEKLIDSMFPTILEMLDFVPALIRSEMAASGLTTVERISGASDQSLLAIAGLGPTRLRKLRAWCRDFQGDRHSSRLAADNAARLRGWTW